MARIVVGTCGFPKARHRCYESFDAVEVQQTFYEPPQPETLARWRAEAPETFEFTVKAYQAITHPPDSPTYRRSKLPPADRALAGFFRDTSVVWNAWHRTQQAATTLRATVVLFQCPARFTPTDEHIANLRKFFGRLDRGGLLFGWEPRGEGWTDDLVRQLCRELQLIHVVDPFQRTPVHRKLNYFRLHGIGGYRYRYTPDDLQRLLRLCRARTTYCFFNNVSMWDDALAFRTLLRHR